MKKTRLITLIFFSLLVLPFSNIKAAAQYGPGSLLALSGVKDAAVYYIGSNGKKYLFPDLKTYQTWYKNFDTVVKVNTVILDQYQDGGVMPYRAGIKLITHPDTAKIYAVSPNGFLHWIPSAELAEQLYGINWQRMVQDVIPGYFPTSYKISEDIFDKYPTGSLLQVKEKLYYVDGINVRLFANHNAIIANNFTDSDFVQVPDLLNYTLGYPISGKEMDLTEYNPSKACCSKP